MEQRTINQTINDETQASEHEGERRKIERSMIERTMMLVKRSQIVSMRAKGDAGGAHSHTSFRGSL
jgi:hypothetical protein